jgi:hypothetical protein
MREVQDVKKIQDCFTKYVENWYSFSENYFLLNVLENRIVLTYV